MGFVRIKKIKGIEYAYLVENTWGGRGSRQKVTGYLGKVYRPARVFNLNFFEHYRIEQKTQYLEALERKKLVRDIIKLELLKHGFSDGEQVLASGTLFVNLDAMQVKNRTKKACLALNEGFLSDATLRRLIDFNETGNQAELSMKLAKAFVEAGIKVEEELFISVYEKIIG